jgi:hypothetical protein
MSFKLMGNRLRSLHFAINFPRVAEKADQRPFLPISTKPFPVEFESEGL